MNRIKFTLGWFPHKCKLFLSSNVFDSAKFNTFSTLILCSHLPLPYMTIGVLAHP